ncbi:MAG TPA: DUF948 domain-containing protein [Syntrophales bacterium]|nr:DUF948 domain-containing protein [Syntrophales bacterium]
MFLEIMAVIVSLVFLLAAIFSIPFLLQLWRTAKSMAATMQMLNESLPGILKNLEEITTSINKATHAVNEQIEGLSLVARRIQGLLGIVSDIEDVLHVGARLPVFKAFRNAFAVLRGVKVFLKVFLASGKCE